MFLLEFKLNRQRSDILASPLWEARMRVKQLAMYYEEKKKALESLGNSAKTGRTPRMMR